MRITSEHSSTRRQRSNRESQLTVPNGLTIPETARVADYMSWSISVVSPETRCNELLHLMTSMNTTVLAVYDGRRYVGLVEAPALSELMKTEDSRCNQMRAREFMDTMSQPCSPHDSLLEVWSRMHRTGQSNLPVVNDDGKLAGVLSTTVCKGPIPTEEAHLALRIVPRSRTEEHGSMNHED